MRRKYFFQVLIFIVLVVSSFSALAKQADLAGDWYSDSPERLKANIEKFLSDADVGNIEGDVIGVITPHAGLRFSGEIAGFAYKALMEKSPEVVVLVGFTHRKYLPGQISILTDDYYLTPLGKATIDKELTKKFLDADPAIENIPGAFSAENSVELQIPFIQVALKDARLVIMAIGDQRMDTVRRLGNALYNVLKDEKSYAMIASTDMSHYLPYEQANAKDAQTIKWIEEFDADSLYRESLKKNHDLMCGNGAVCSVMSASKRLGADKVEILKYANSGDTFGSKNRVVGYLSAAFVKTLVDEKVAGEKTMESEEADMFNEEQKKKLLEIARNSIGHYLKTGKQLDLEVDDDVLKQDMGAFVTLNKGGRLRGCIGHMDATSPLYLTVRDMAVLAAVEDPRFPPLTIEELDEVEIEISALSPMEKIDDYEIIEPGKHGVVVRMGLRGGVYLPQVATDNKWDRETFMNSLCQDKSGLPRDAWKTGEADLYVFTAEVFGEKESKHE